MKDDGICTIRRWATFTVVFIENVLFGGCNFGWAPLVYILKSKQVYLDLCFHNSSSSNSTLGFEYGDEHDQLAIFKGCKEQDKKFAMVFTISLASYNCSSVFVGYFLHHYGIYKSRFVASVMNVAGFIILGLTSKEQPNWILGAVVILSVSNNQLRVCSLGIADLFQKYKSTALTAMSGAYSASASLFLVVQMLVEGGIPFSYACWFLAGVASLSMPLTFLIPSKLNVKQAMAEKPHGKIPIKRSLFSLSAMLYFYWLNTVALCTMYFITSYNSWISNIASTDGEAALYSQLFSMSSFVYPFITFLPGIITDIALKHTSSDGTPLGNRVRDVKCTAWATFLLSFCALSKVCCLFSKTPIAIYLSLVMMTLTRPIMLGSGYCFLKTRFPFDHFSRLVGFSGAALMMSSTLAFPFFIWTQQQFFIAMACFIVLYCLGFSHPIHLLFKNHIRAKLENTST